jgi:acetylornithine deacetylase/succinyl-diaminopimelate desuccinylase-like protein
MHLPSERELRDEATALLRDLLRIDTGNPPGGETPAAAHLARYLEGHGVECELIAREPERANLVARIRGRIPRSPAMSTTPATSGAAGRRT